MRTSILGQANSLAALKHLKANPNDICESARVETIKSQFDNLESTFVASNGTSVDKASENPKKVIIDSTGVCWRDFIKVLPLPFPLSITQAALAPEKILGVAHLDEQGKIKTLQAEVSTTRLGQTANLVEYSTSTLTMSTGRNGRKTYSLDEGSFGGKTTIEESRDGTLVLLRDDEVLRRDKSRRKSGIA